MSRGRIALALVAAVAAAAALSWLWPRPPGSDDAARRQIAGWSPRPEALNVLFVTLDTLRADRLGCYGFRGVATPTIDALARESVLFEQATATVPLTLPSHASLLTGLLPPRHGQHDNGVSFLAESQTTLAERFHAAGYATGGFVGAFVLESRWGLAQGFDRYSDKLDPDQFQRRGDRVVEDALDWIGSVRDRRFFAWVHLFDPHLPYDPPEPYRSRYAGAPYLGEVAWTDELVGRLLSRLRAENLYERTAIVLTADHGESLGEHGEPSHGYFVYDSTTAVPLLVRTPWGLRGRSRTQVSGVDLFPTMLDLAGLAPQPGIDGRSLLRALIDPGADLGRLAYSETYYPRYHFGWQHLRAVRDGAYKLIDAPRPELYELATDAGETRNIHRARARTAESLRLALEGLARESDEAPAGQGPDPETRQRLAALGYVGSLVDADPRAVLPDPKDKVHLFGLMNEAREAADAGRVEQAIAAMRRVVAEDPAIMDAHLSLGRWLARAGRSDEAIDSLRRAFALKPDDGVVLQDLVRLYLRAGRTKDMQDALGVFAGALASGPGNPGGWYELATIYLEIGREREAETALRHALEANPNLAAAHNALGAIAYQRGELDAAEARVRQALAVEPDLPTARFNLARVLEARGRDADAEPLYRQELADNPGHGRAHLNLALLLKRRGDGEGYLAELRRGVEQAPRSGACYLFLAHEELRAGRLDAAAGLAKRGLELDRSSDAAPLGFYVLADVFGRQGRPAEAEAALGQARRMQAALGGRPRGRTGT